MKARIIKPASHEEWLAERNKGVGASEVGSILSLSPYETPYQLYRRKKGIDPATTENKFMLMGHLLEEVVAQRFTMETGIPYVKASAADIIYVDGEHDYMRVTPDRILKLKDENGKSVKGLLEIKTAQKDMSPDDIPDHYLAQVLYQMRVTGIHRAYLAWLVRGVDFGYAEIAYDEDFVEYMVNAVQDFWENNILADVEPPMSTPDDVMLRRPTSTPDKTVDADDAALADIARLRELNEEIRVREDEANRLKAGLQVYMDDSEAIMQDGKPIVTWKSGKATRSFDWNAYLADHKKECLPYFKDNIPSRRFIIKK